MPNQLKHSRTQWVLVNTYTKCITQLFYEKQHLYQLRFNGFKYMTNQRKRAPVKTKETHLSSQDGPSQRQVSGTDQPMNVFGQCRH